MQAAIIKFKLLFFLSGAAGLIYEVIWARLFADILGSTALSMTTVFSVFLLALAIGAQIFGRTESYGRAALILYVKLELGIAVSATVISILLITGKSWIAVHVPSSDIFALSLFYKFVVVALLIGVPTVLMGGTLPVILNATRDWILPRQIVAQLYGWNTIGAATGTFLTGFVLIWKLGLSATLAIAVGLNLAVGLLFFLWARKTEVTAPSPVLTDSDHPKSIGSPREQRLWFGFAFLSGFAVLAYEVLWGRMAKFLLGDRTIAITALLFIFIICLGMGSLIAPRIGRIFKVETPQQALKLIAWILIISGLLHLAMVPIAETIVQGQELASLLSHGNKFVRRLITVWILISPSIIVLGLVFPLLAWSAQNINTMPGKVMGNLYFVNTIGATIGAITASYALSRWTGTLWAFLLITGLLVAPTVMYLVFNHHKIWHKGLAVSSLIMVLTAGIWFPKKIVMLCEGEELIAYNEDEYGVQTLTRTPGGMVRVRNNRLNLIYDLGHPQTTHAQQMAAHLSILLAKGCGDVLNIGTGYGITAGTFTLYPDVQSIDTIEILPFLIYHQNTFASHNFNYIEDARVHLSQGDGRHALVTSEKKYDVISVNVLDPYLPGSSSLYTVDLWQEAHDHLRPGGVYTQLVWGQDVSLLVKGLNTVFPTVLYFRAYENTSFNVVGFKDAVTPDTALLHLDRIGPEARATLEKILRKKNINQSLEIGLNKAWDLQTKFNELARKNSGAIHTDDFPVLEFRWAHGVKNVSVFDSPLVEE